MTKDEIKFNKVICIDPIGADADTLTFFTVIVYPNISQGTDEPVLFRSELPYYFFMCAEHVSDMIESENSSTLLSHMTGKEMENESHRGDLNYSVSK